MGRIGLLVDGRPEILPVNYALDGETVLFRTNGISVLNQASLREVAFEADHVDEVNRTGWSVLVQGTPGTSATPSTRLRGIFSSSA